MSQIYSTPLTTLKCDICGGNDFQIDIRHIKDYFTGMGSFDIVECKKCGHHFTYPIPSPAEMDAFYPEDYYLHFYGHTEQKTSFKDSIRWFLKAQCYSQNRRLQNRRHNTSCGFLNRLFGEPPMVAGGELLDVGCGIGEYLRFAASCGWTVTGVEPDEEIQRADVAAGLDVKRGIAEDLPLKDESFDVVRLWHVLEHTHSPVSALKEANRVLNPEGLLLVSVPDYGSSQRKALGKYWPPLDVPRHLHHFTSSSLGRALEESGFRMECKLYSCMPLFWMRWKPAVFRSQGAGNAKIIKLIISSIVGEAIGRLGGSQSGGLITWLARKTD